MRIRWVGGPLPLLLARGVIVLASFGLLIYLVMWGIDLFQRVRSAASSTPHVPVEQQLATNQAELTRLQAEHDAAVAAADIKSKALIGQNARLKALESETARLNEDLDAMAVHLPLDHTKPLMFRLHAVQSGPKTLKYRFFVTQGNRKLVPTVELALTTQSGVLKFPGCELKSALVARCEGNLDLPDGAKPTKLEVHLLERGVLRVTESAKVYNE